MRWAPSTTRTTADRLWPVDALAVTSLLAARGIGEDAAPATAIGEGDLVSLPRRESAALDKGDWVVLDGVHLGVVESVRTDAKGRPEYMVRHLVDGRDWSRTTSAHPAQRLVAVDAGAAEDLLEANGLPTPAPTARAASAAPVAAPVPAAEPEPSAPPMPAGRYAEVFAKVAFEGDFRRYQGLALEAFEKARAAGRRRVYLVMPPGSGKTLVGLEIARRLGNPTLALGPNTAIQSQWLKQWTGYAPALVAAGSSPELEAPITALTYQALCDLDSHNPALDEQVAELLAAEGGQHPAAVDNPQHRAEVARLRGHARVAIAQSRDHQRLISILHANGRRIVDRIQAAGRFTLVLDECHHLFEMWGYLLRALVHELGDDVFVVGLTATPPAELGPQEAVVYQELFGRADFEVPTPAVVKEGNLAPYQELAYLTSPLDQELAYMAEEKTRFEELITEIERPDLGTVAFRDWLRARVFERRSKEGAQVAWSRFEVDHPELALAALRYCGANGMDIPTGARMGEAQRRPLTAADWVALIGDYCTGHLRESADPRDLEVWEMIRRALPSLGYVLTRDGIRSYVSPVDRVLLLSASKGLAAIDILAAEARALGDRMRALLLCDYEVAGSELVGKLRGVLDPQAGSAALLLSTLLQDEAAAALDPILVTGKTVACSQATASALLPWLGSDGPSLTAASGSWESVVEIRPKGGDWSPSVYLPLITRYFEEGGSRCLVGTRGLLGEGWDAKTVNVLVDLTGVTTTTSVHQMRGRSLRLDPTLPHKVADNWDVVCVTRDHPKGTADYERFVRKHRSYFSITAAGEIESGVSHVDARLSPFGPPADDLVAAINSDVLGRCGGSEAVYALWGIGQPYNNLPAETVRIRSGRVLGLSSRRLGSPPMLRTRSFGALAGGAAVLLAGVAVGHDLAGPLVAFGIAVGGLGWAARSVQARASRLGPSGSLEDMAAAVAEALAGCGLIDRGLGAAAVRVVLQPDGYYRCLLDGASLADSAAFATALDELVAPLASPRYVIPRFVEAPPASLVDGFRLLVRRLGAPRFGAAMVYHAVPSALAANRERVSAFEASWHRYVSAGQALYASDPRAQAMIQLQRGEDPFAVTTQLRTLWE